MTTIKNTKTFKLLLLLALLSISFTSCSPTDELSREVSNVDEVDEVEEREPWINSVFIIVGYNYDTFDACEVGVIEPIYELVLADLDRDTKELISVTEVISDSDFILQQHTFYQGTTDAGDPNNPRYNYHPYTWYFINSNAPIEGVDEGCAYPLVINPDLDRQEQLDRHLNPNLFVGCDDYYGWDMDKVNSVLECDYTNSWVNYDE